MLELGVAASPSVLAGSQSLRLFSLPEKEPLRGQRVTTEDEVNEAFKVSLTIVTKSGVCDGIDGLVHRWKKCMEVEGVY